MVIAPVPRSHARRQIVLGRIALLSVLAVVALDRSADLAGVLTSTAAPTTVASATPEGPGRLVSPSLRALNPVRTVRDLALDLRLDPARSLAVALVETAGTLDPATRGDRRPGDPRAIDGFCSYGLFQLNVCGGEGAGLTASDLVDPVTNARVALRGHAKVIEGGSFSSPAQAVVRGFQRPATAAVDPYIAAISPGGARYVEAERLLAELDD